MIAANRYHRGQGVKYALLVLLLAAAAGDLIGRLLRVSIDSPAMVAGIAAVLLVLGAGVARATKRSVKRWTAGIAMAAIGVAALGLLTDGSRLLAASLQTGLLDPIPLFLPVG